jgi:putative membrane protein
MIIYKSRDWWTAIRHFHTTHTIQLLFQRVALVGLYVTFLAVAEFQYINFSFQVEREYFSFLGILLSLLLVFRTNTAYDRFYEGRTLWGQLVNNCRNMAIMLNSILPKADMSNRLLYAKLLSNFAIALEGHLREGVQFEKLEPMDGYTESVRQADHVPAMITAILQDRIEELQREQVLLPVHLLTLKPHHQALMDICGGCERIKKTPIPFSYSFFIKGFITVFILLIPFVLMDTYRYFVIPITMFGAYALLGVEMIGDEIEDPFQKESNHLPLSQISNSIRADVHTLLSIPLPDYKKAFADVPYTVVH